MVKKFSLRLSPSAGSYATSPRWSNKDLDPVPVKERRWTTLDYFNYWNADMLAPPLWSTISTVVSIGFTAKEIIPMTFFGFLIISFVITATGNIAAKYNTPFPVLARVSFGVWGCIPAILIRSFVAMMWTSITILIGGGFIQNMITAIWPSFAGFPNHLPESANITSASLLCTFIYWGVIQTPISLMPIQKLRYFFLFKSIIVPPTWLALFIWGMAVTNGGGALFHGDIIIQNGLSKPFAALASMNAIIGLFSSLAVNMPDFGRFAKNERAGWSQVAILPVLGTLGSLAPLAVTAAYQAQHGEYEWFLPVVIGRFDSRAAMFFTAFSFVIATLGNNIAAGSFPFSNDISALAPHYINIFRGTLIMAVFCIAATPWNIVANAGGLLAFLGGYSCLMAPLAAIMICDFYIIRQEKLNISEMYNPHGIYRYNKGWNWRAWLTMGIAFAPVAPGFFNSIYMASTPADEMPTPIISIGAENLYSMAWLYAFTTGFLVYYVLNKFISPPTASLVDVAVLPPKTQEEEDAFIASKGYSHTDGVSSDEEKGISAEIKEIKN